MYSPFQSETGIALGVKNWYALDVSVKIAVLCIADCDIVKKAAPILASLVGEE